MAARGGVGHRAEVAALPDGAGKGVLRAEGRVDGKVSHSVV